MKKRTNLFLIISLFILIVTGLLIYIFNKPQIVENEIVGNEYNAKYIQFNLVSNTFSTTPENVIEKDAKTHTTFVSSDNKIISVSPIEKDNLFVNYDNINNPFYIFKEEVKGTYTLFSSKDWRFATIKILHGENKDFIYYYAKGSEDDGSFSRYIEVIEGDSYYSITLANYDSESNVDADAYEIISSINIIKD